MPGLTKRRCRNLPEGTQPLTQPEITRLLAELPGWEHCDGSIRKTYEFANYGGTMAFANGVAWIAHREDHHPDMLVTYSRCRVAFNTHSIGGISINDFICAAKVEALI